MTNPSKSGQRCKVIGGRTTANGEGTSPNYGKIVTTIEIIGQAGIEEENVWRCSGNNIVGYYGTMGCEGQFLECWLEVIPPEPEKVKELENQIESHSMHVVQTDI